MVMQIHDRVSRLDVPVYDPMSMGGVKRGRKLPQQADGTPDRKRARLSHDAPKRLSFQQIHGEVMNSVLRSDIVDLYDVWVAQAGSSSSFAHEPRNECGIGADSGGKNLDRS